MKKKGGWKTLALLVASYCNADDCASVDVGAPLNALPGLGTCMAAPAGLNMESIGRDISTLDTCGDVIVDDLIGNEFLLRAVSMGASVWTSVQNNDMHLALPIAVSFLSSVQNQEVDSLCALLNTKITRCLVDLIPTVLERIKTERCCGELKSILDIAAYAVVPKYDGIDAIDSLKQLVKTLVYDVNSILCSKRNPGGERCGYNLIHYLFPSKNLATTMQHLLAKLPVMFPLAHDNQCSSLNGAENGPLWEYGGCSVSFENTLAYVRHSPLAHAFYRTTIPIVGVALRDVFEGWKEAPCCEFKTTANAPDDIFGSMQIPPVCNAGDKKTCNPAIKLPFILDGIPGLGQCMSANDGFSFLNLLKVLGASPRCDIMSMVTSVFANPLIQKVTSAFPEIMDAFQKDAAVGITKLLALTSSLTNDDFNSACSILNTSLLTCMADVMPQLAALFNSPCCGDFNALVNTLAPFVVPKRLHGSVRQLIETLLMDVNNLVCSTRSDDERCGFNLVSQVFGSLSDAVTMLSKIFKVPYDQQCPAFSGKSYTQKDGGSKATLWDFGQCSSSWESFMSTLRSIPLTHLLNGMDIPLVGKVGGIFAGWPATPCCEFDTTTTLPTDVFYTTRPDPSCLSEIPVDDSADDCTGGNTDILPFPFGMLPGAIQCIGSQDGLSLINILDDFSSCPKCGISVVMELMNNEFMMKAVGKVADIVGDADTDMNGKLMAVVVWLIGVKNDEFLSMCEYLNATLFPCINQWLPKILKRLDSSCCSTFGTIVDLATLLILPEGAHGGLEGLIKTLLYDVDSTICSVRTASGITCGFNLLQNILSHIGTAWDIPAADQCSALGGNPFNGGHKLWDYGECSIPLTNTFELLRGVPLLSVFSTLEMMPGMTVGGVLNAWTEAPCCAFETKITRIPEDLFDVKLPTAVCQARKLPVPEGCQDSTVIPHVLHLKEIGGMTKCFGSGFSVGAIMDHFGESATCSKFLFQDILNGKDPAAKAIKDQIESVMKKMKDDHVAGMLFGIQDILTAMRSLTNGGIGLFCSFLDNSLGACVADMMDFTLQLVQENECCDGFYKVLDQFYQQLIKPTNHDEYTSLPILIKGLVNNLNAVMCTKHTEDFLPNTQSQYCGFTLATNTLGFDYLEKSPDLDPLTAVAIYTLYPLFRLLTVPAGEGCSFLQKHEYIYNDETCSTWKGMWFKYGCCGAPLGGLVQTIGSIPVVAPLLESIEFDLMNLGLGHFLQPSLRLSNLVRGYPDIGCCAKDLGQCEYTLGSVFNVKLPGIPQCQRFDNTCSKNA